MFRFRIEVQVGVVLLGSLSAHFLSAAEPTVTRKPLQYLPSGNSATSRGYAAAISNQANEERATPIAPPVDAPAPSPVLVPSKSPIGKNTIGKEAVGKDTRVVPSNAMDTDSSTGTRRARLARPALYFAKGENAEQEEVEKSPSDKGVVPEPLPQPGDQEDEDKSGNATDRGEMKDHHGLELERESSSEAGKLELERFQGLALDGNPGLREASAQMEAIRGKWIQAGLPPNPFLGYSGQQLASRGLAEQHGLAFGQTFITGHKLRLDQAAVSQEWSRAQYQFEAQRLRILTDTAIAYYEAIAAQRKVELAQELVVIGDQAVQTAEALFKAKERSKIDVNQAKIETEAVRIVLENSNQRRAAAWRLLGAVTGNRDLPMEQLQGSLKDGPAEVTWEVALGRLRTGSPELFAAMAEVERARWLYQRAVKQNVPNVDVQAIPFQRDNGVKGWDGALQVGASIPVWNRNQGAIREAWMRISVAEQAVDRIDLGLQARLSLVFERYLAAERQIARYEQDILPAAREQLDLVTQVYRRGESDSLSVLVARRTLAQTSLAYIDALRDRAAAASEIEGMLLRESLLNAPGG